MNLKLAKFVVALLFGTAAANAQSFAVGTCLPNLPHYQKIQDAVSGVTPGSTIFVCPNVYPEQVTISQPLTLQGVAFHGQDRPVIAVPAGDPATGGGLQVNAFAIGGAQFAAQVLVHNVQPPGDVNIVNMTIDGNGAPTGCSNSIFVPSTFLAGIFFDLGSGSVKNSTIRNQKELIPGCGDGIFVQSFIVSDSIEISNTSVHDFDGIGIIATSPASTLNVSIIYNAVHGLANSTGIDAETILGDVSHNVVTGGYEGIHDSNSSNYGAPGITLNDNDVADTNIGMTVRGGSTAKSNRIASTSTAFYLIGGSGTLVPSILSNAVKNTNVGIEYNCIAKVPVKSNTITDTAVAFDQVPLSRVLLSLVNQIADADTIETLCQ
jgi:hypothetical protein